MCPQMSTTPGAKSGSKAGLGGWWRGRPRMESCVRVQMGQRTKMREAAGLGLEMAATTRWKRDSSS